MLQLQANSIDICRISKLLTKYDIKAHITDSVITLEGDISEELLDKLCSNIKIIGVQNFICKESFEETSFSKTDKLIQNEELKLKNNKTSIIPPPHSLEYDLIYPKVKRGEVYWCDFGEPYGCEQGGYRPAIVIQNNISNSCPSVTIVIPCSSNCKKVFAHNYIFNFSSQNMVDYSPSRITPKYSKLVTEQIRAVDKSRFRSYIGQLTPEFMKIIQEKIDILLEFNRRVENTTKPKKESTVKSQKKSIIVEKYSKNLNDIQINLLSFVDNNKLFEILQTSSTYEIKTEKILELFGFDLNKNGVQYLKKAIIASTKINYFNLEILSQYISINETVDSNEFQRLIVARVKERFAFKKSPTIDFIRLVNFLLKGD